MASITHDIHKNIQGWFSFPNFYTNLVQQAKDGFHFVEVGSWKGKSACFLAVEIINSGKLIKFDCVDTWEGSIEHKDVTSSHYEPLLSTPDGLYNEFLQNIKPVANVINPIRKKSTEAALLYEDNSLNCVFIDAAHEYEDVCMDVNYWLPKIKKGNILSGHDYFHGPVKQALNDTIGLNKIIDCGESVWAYKVI